MIKFGLVSLMVLALTQAKALTAQDSVLLTLYYESLCPACMEFITEQLHGTYQAFGPDKIKLELIPWGWAREVEQNGTKQIACQHGPQECIGNKLHACALGLNSIEIAEKFIYCTEGLDSFYSDIAAVQKCADDNGTPWNDINECMSNGQGDGFLSVYQKKTAEAAAKFMQWTPTIVFGGVYNKTDDIRSGDDLKGVICEKLGNPKECEQ